MQFTLLLTIALVVMVIFIFLRSVLATIIPSVTVPLALLSACPQMWVAGYSLNNMSLMALTIAIGLDEKYDWGSPLVRNLSLGCRTASEMV